MRKPLHEFADEPLYNMKAVEQQTSISAATLRAWERRYRLVEPKRTPSGYRLYSDRDVALLRWVRDRMAEGLTVSRVVAMLKGMRTAGETLWIDEHENGSGLLAGDTPLPPAKLVHPLYMALVDLDDERANEILDQAFAMYTLPTVYVEIITPTLVEIGEAWHRGDIFIATEHFATSYLRGRLLGLLQTFPPRPDMPLVFVGCAPGERHEIGPLIFAAMLRQHGFNVVFLGQDVPLDDMIGAALGEHPAMICLSASSPATALMLRAVQDRLDREAPIVTYFGYGGRAFDLDPKLRSEVRGYYLGADPRDAVNAVSNLIRNHRAS